MQTPKTIKQLCEDIYKEQVENDEWSVVDTQDPLKRTVVSPMLCNNHAKLVKSAQLILSVSQSDMPQHRDIELCKAIRSLLGFARAHNIDVEKIITTKIEPSED